MPVTTEHYDQLKIDKLKHYLEMQFQKGNAVNYEIFVDNLKVVPRTEDPKEFENYEFYMNEDTEKVRILIYAYGMSPRNDQYCFMVQKNKMEKGLNGLGEIENIVQEKLAARDREHEMNRLKEELEAAKEELQETEEYVQKLEKEIEYMKENKFKLGNINMGEFASVALEGMLRRNPQILTKLPGGEALAGLIAQDNKEQEAKMLNPQPPVETEATFQKKESTGHQFSDIEVRQLAFLNQLQEGFDQKQVEVFNIILGRLAAEPAKLQEIATLFNINY